jgi:hypothetical protein
MLKRLLAATAFITLIFPGVLHAQILINRDTLVNILQQKDQPGRQARLIRFVKTYLQSAPANEAAAGRDSLFTLFDKYGLQNKEAFVYFTEGIYLNKIKNLKGAESQMEKAIQLATQKDDSFLLYQFTTHLGFIQTDQGNFTGAIYSYRMAKQQALKLKDNFLQALLDVNISDLYYKSSFYTQSINYLDQALDILRLDNGMYMKRLAVVIYYNKSENYFRMRNADSLKVYHQKLLDTSFHSYKIYTYRQRTAYYLSLLRHDYPSAVKLITDLKKHPRYVFSELEDLNLSDAYFMNGQLDSAKTLVTNLLAVAGDSNHPEIRYHLYELLAQIALKRGDNALASRNFELALKESEENNARIAQVGNISSQIKIDETEDSYIQKAEKYQRERMWLIFTVVVAALSIVAIALIYRNVKQKRHYEMLLFAAKKEELAFINSHEVRRHLTNILGIVDILKNSTDKINDYEQVEPYLLESAAKLDEAIKSISEKLNE